MTPLKALILLTLKTSGPLSDLGLWAKMRDQETGGLSATVVICCIELQQEGLIQAPANDPHCWELSDLGLEVVRTRIRRERVHV